MHIWPQLIELLLRWPLKVELISGDLIAPKRQLAQPVPVLRFGDELSHEHCFEYALLLLEKLLHLLVEVDCLSPGYLNIFGPVSLILSKNVLKLSMPQCQALDVGLLVLGEEARGLSIALDVPFYFLANTL